ncbi:hypothetical protein APV47_05820 [Staphylococcus aureus]|uniref:Uncharacterized protein n=1 Tax=Staphylococcus epidermidis TaxID=1282 RepID=A0A0D4ZYB5_STAEP|nr:MULTISPECIES: hypothetical protein [Staphylococcus]AJW29159.1 hypothetical protein [Staphylococcus epidermidis]ARA73634.1 hypothetical protein [Staphylococcus epidermidis]KZG49409.1 hypothetical protein A4U44_00325 [Staphylococcus epidermidis]KZG55056.1 hypothetical protein A0W31_03930 [Staphylococcus epidermidis]KZG55365.1 hypothetical protein A0W30_06225 [Staphylococcus epidermidis]
MLVIIPMLAIVLVIILLKLNDKRVERIIKEHDQRIKEIIETYYTIDKVESIYKENGKTELMFKDNSLNLNSYQVKIVDSLEEERVVIEAPLYNTTDINDLFELVLAETYFYIAEDRYNGLIRISA